MNTIHSTAPRTRLVTAAITVALAGCGLSLPAHLSWADEGVPTDVPAVDAIPSAEPTPAASPIRTAAFTAEQIAADPILSSLVANESTIGVNFAVQNDTAMASGLAATINSNRVVALASDSEITAAAYQRAAETALLNSELIRPDGSLFTTIDQTGAGRILAEVLITIDPGTVVTDPSVLYESLTEDQKALLASESYTSMGIGVIIDASGATHCVILLGGDAATPSENVDINTGEAVYYASVPVANTFATNFGTPIEVEAGQSVAAPVQATLQGELVYGEGLVAGFTYTALNVNTNAGIWNSSSTSVASAVDGMITGIAAGTCNVSMTNALSVQAGTQYLYSVTVTGGEESTAINLVDCMVAGITGPQTYEGWPVTPPFSVIDSNSQTVDPALYTFTYSNNEGAGAATLTITAVPDNPAITGELTYDFAVVSAIVDDPAFDENAQDGTDVPQEDGSNANESATDLDAPQDGSKQDPTTDVNPPADGQSADGQQTDEPQSASLTVDLASEQISASLADPTRNPTYQGSEIKPDIIVKDGEHTLEPNVDYTVTYTDNVNAGVATVIIKGVSPLYTGTRELQFTIDPQNIDAYEAGPIVSATYTGSPIEQPKLEVKNATTLLTNGVDYTVAYENNVNAGTATLHIIGINNYAGEKELKFTITPVSMSKVTVVMPNQAYTGQALTPSPLSVTMGDTQLVAGVDYDVVGYTNNMNVGNATITLKGKGNFDGTLAANWKIVQQNTTDAGTTQTLPKTGDTTNIVPIVVAVVAGIALIGTAVALIVARGHKKH